jgi:hypothetical protein
MLEMARLVGTPLEGIILQTRARNNLANSQSCEPDATIRARYEGLRRKHFAWLNRKPACGVYNCFGLVWASRRTAIYEESDISQILKDDGYRQLVSDLELLPGDVVLYRHLGNTRHAAMVVELKPLGASMVPWVLSKWGPVFGEDLHAFLDVPKDLEDCMIQFWTDRPL